MTERAMAEPLLVLDDVRAGYGDSIVLEGVSLEMPEQGSLAVLGRNGVGKSTLLLTIMGYTNIARGRIVWRGDDITARPPHRRGRRRPSRGAPEPGASPSPARAGKRSAAAPPGA